MSHAPDAQAHASVSRNILTGDLDRCRSGLSNAALGGKEAQGFGNRDRAGLAVTPELAGDRAVRKAVSEQIDQVRRELEESLRRPGLVCAEQYYSVGGPGARLPLHMDERHEENKGVRGWANTYRRSISWLVYLSEPGWDATDGSGCGGALQAHVRERAIGACGSHEQNLQVGWRALESGDEEPVFWDAWVRAPHPLWAAGDLDAPKWISLSALYRSAWWWEEARIGVRC